MHRAIGAQECGAVRAARISCDEIDAATEDVQTIPAAAVDLLDTATLAAMAQRAVDNGRYEVAVKLWRLADEQIMGPVVEARRRARAQA